MGCFRFIFGALWRALLAALIALAFARIDTYIERSGRRDRLVGRAWRGYRKSKRHID